MVAEYLLVFYRSIEMIENIMKSKTSVIHIFHTL